MHEVQATEQESDHLRLNDLVRHHQLSFERRGSLYYFDDRTGIDASSDGYISVANDLREALAFAEGFDRASQR